MGARGPIPERSDERIRRNKPETPIEKVSAIGAVPIPDLGLENPHPIVSDLYQSLLDSAQSRFYEPSDWHYARIALHFANQLLHSGRPNGQLLTVVNSMLTDLLVSEGSRRRVRLEIERAGSGETGQVLDVADMFRQRLAQQ